MKKSLSRKRQAIRNLRTAIREGRKLARQINRKLESLAKWNKVKTAAKEELVKIMGLK